MATTNLSISTTLLLQQTFPNRERKDRFLAAPLQTASPFQSSLVFTHALIITISSTLRNLTTTAKRLRWLLYLQLPLRALLRVKYRFLNPYKRRRGLAANDFFAKWYRHVQQCTHWPKPLQLHLPQQSKIGHLHRQHGSLIFRLWPTACSHWQHHWNHWVNSFSLQVRKPRIRPEP